jgi:hypothetical protein
MSNVLLVPVHLDALCLKTDLSVVEAKLIFPPSLLGWEMRDQP